jgi:serine/threonine-protein kinase
MIAETIAHYRILGRLGAGGMGEVYLADDAKLGRKVAIKLLPPGLREDEHARRRQHREARAAAALEHPNICSIYEIGEAEGRSFIVMQYVEGETLADRIRRRPLDWREALDLAVQIADALSHAHAHGVVHRDIKPHNVMVSARGAKVLDFGLAKNQAESEAQTETGLTARGAIVGTMPYMSPEQVRGEEPDGRSDIFSFGSLLYELFSGRAPFAAGTSGETAAAILTRDPEPIARYASGVAPELNRIVRKCLAKDRDQRYQGMREVFTDLESFRRDLDQEQSAASRADRAAQPAGTVARRRSIAFRWALGATTAVALTAAMLLWLRPFGRAPSTAADIQSLAVMPLKPLDRASTDDYFGLGIANAIITKVSQVGGLTVRPTSAVRKYVDGEIDALEAARQLQVDSVLDGSFQRSGDRLRVTVNLLKAADGASLWSQDFDVRATDIFTIQDDISQQVAARIRAEVTPGEQARLVKRQTSNLAAYDYYMKAVYLFSDRQWATRPRGPSDQAIELFKQAIALDPNYAQAHAQLGYGYAWTAINFQEDASLIELAKQEIDLAEKLDPQLAEPHVARAFILWSQYEGWQVQPAIRELRLAQRYDPNAGHLELADIYMHIGLDEQYDREMALALALNPTSDIIKQTWVNVAYIRALPDQGAAAERKFFNRNPRAAYYIIKRMPEQAEPLVADAARNDPTSPWTRADQALLLALGGKHREATGAVPSILEAALQTHRTYHHLAYDLARIYALGGDGPAAVKWLRIATDQGFPNYTLFQRDTFLDPIRQQPAFLQFMSELKTRWEGYQRELGS